jgi:hypothetical protein
MSSGLKSFVDSVIIILSTGYTIGCLSAIGCALSARPSDQITDSRINCLCLPLLQVAHQPCRQALTAMNCWTLVAHPFTVTRHVAQAIRILDYDRTTHLFITVL